MRRHRAVPLFCIMVLCCLLSVATCRAMDISGTVVDENGKPLAGVRVCAGVTESADGMKGTEATTDGEGKFTIIGARNPSAQNGVAVEAYVPGRVPSSAFITSTEPKPLVIKLLPAGKVTIQLLTMDGKPASGAKVAPAIGKYPGYWGLIRSTGPDGKITLPFVPAKGLTYLSIADSRYVHSDITLRCPEDDGAKFRVIPGGSIQGKAVDASGNPVAGMTVRAMSNEGGFWGGYGNAVTKADGTFAIERLDSGSFIVYVEPKNGLAAKTVSYEVERGKITKLSTTRVSASGKIEGVILDKETGKPVAGMEVQYEPEVWPESWAGESTVTDKDGRFTIAGVGTFSITPVLWGSDYNYEANPGVDQTITLDPGQTVKPEIKLSKTPVHRYEPGAPQAPAEPTKTLRALVIDEQGKPLPKCDLRLMDREVAKTLATLSTDERGEASIATPEGEAFTWVASKSGYTDAWNKTTNRVSDPVVLRMFKARPVRGQVVNEQGKAVPNAKVTVISLFGACFDGRWAQGHSVKPQNLMKQAPSVVTDSRGVFSLSGIPTKTSIKVEVTHPKYLTMRKEVVIPNDYAKLVALSPYTLRGKVTGLGQDTGRIPLQAAIYWNGDCEGNALATVKPDGTFAVTGVPGLSAISTGRVYVRVTLLQDDKRPLSETVKFTDGRMIGYERIVEVAQTGGKTRCFGIKPAGVTADAMKTGIVVRADQVVKVAGILKGMDGKPMPDTEICYQTEPMIRAGENTLQVARSDKDGRFTMLAPPGRVKIMPVKGRVLGKTVMITASIFTSGRDIVVDMAKAFADVGHAQTNAVTEYVRVIDPDGVAVPRPILQEGSAGKTMFQPASGLDGTVALRGDKGTQVKLTSPFMKKPVTIKLEQNDRVTTVRFDTRQTILPTTAEWAEATGAGFG